MNIFQSICQQIISPPKIHYSTYDLGATINPFGKRFDFQCINPIGFKIQTSFYKTNQPAHHDTCVLYLHSMNGSRLQSTPYVETILKMGLSFACFDFSGCGNSQGNSISFGVNEQHDIAAVIQILKDNFSTKKFILWGRSMGSASAIKYCQHLNQYQPNQLQNTVAGVILDSCFRSFSTLAIEIGRRHSQVPQFLIKIGYFFIKSTLQQKGRFKVEQLQLQPIIQKLQIPILFLASTQDTTVDIEHSKCLYQRNPHPKKKIHFFRGAHNETRNTQYITEVKKFIEQILIQRTPPTKTTTTLNQHTKNHKFKYPKKPLQTEFIAWENQPSTCNCSFFNNTINSHEIEINDLVPTTRRKMSAPFLQKPRLPKKQPQSRSIRLLPSTPLN